MHEGVIIKVPSYHGIIQTDDNPVGVLDSYELRYNFSLFKESIAGKFLSDSHQRSFENKP